MEKKKKISYDDILASLKMSVNSNGKLEFVRNDKEAIQSSKLTDQINNKYSKPKTNQQMQQQQGQQQRQQQQGKQNLAKQAMQTKHVVRPVQVRYANSITGPNTGPNTRSITGPNIPPNQIPPKQDYLKPYFNIDEELLKRGKKSQKSLKKYFNHLSCAHSTQKLVKIHNIFAYLMFAMLDKYRFVKYSYISHRPKKD